MKFLYLLILIFSSNIYAREVGQIEITTDEGIEVFKEEKYYLLKKNVKIVSDEFELSADMVQAYFEKDLYDIIKIFSKGNVILKSTKGISASGNNLEFDIKNENLKVSGMNSLLINKKVKMVSDEVIQVNNQSGKFNIEGPNSKLESDDIFITGSLIKGEYSKLENDNDFKNLYVEDKKELYIKTETLDMYALKAIYDSSKTIELFDNVKILRDNESISGDYAKINIENESYKVTSNNTEKVKVLLNKVDE